MGISWIWEIDPRQSNLLSKGGSRTVSAFCRWYEKDMKNLTEHEQEQCKENGQNCFDCPDLAEKRNEEESQ